MFTAARLLILGTLILTSCGTARNAAVSTFRVIDTPARYVRDRIDQPDNQTTTTTTTQTTYPNSDVVTPGHSVAPQVPPPAAHERVVAESRPSATPRPSPRSTRSETASTQPKPSPSTVRSAPPQGSEFPTARPVPGKPGFVYSLDPSGGMVDVTGYKSGDKAKDPYTHQIFIIP